MSFIDPANFEAVEILVRPLKDDLDDPWPIVKAFCVGSLVVSLVVWIFSANVSSEKFEQAKQILNVTGGVAFALFVTTYLMLFLKIRQNDKDNVQAKIKKVKEFR